MGHKCGSVSPIALIFLALTLLLLPLPWVGAMLLAMAIHEGSHYLAIRLCGGVAGQIRVGMNGIQMEVGNLNVWQELICALAGPLGGFLLFFTAHWLPRTAVCGGFQSLFNLLPVYPLDGGRALRCCSELLFSPKISARFCRYTEMVCLSGILCLGIYAAFGLRLGLMPIGIALLLFHRSFAGKIPCKPGRFSLQ